MDEKVKKVLMSFAMRASIAALLFGGLCIIKWASPYLFDRCSAVWTKSTDLKKTGALIIQLLKEVIPF